MSLLPYFRSLFVGRRVPELEGRVRFLILSPLIRICMPKPAFNFLGQPLVLKSFPRRHRRWSRQNEKGTELLEKIVGDHGIIEG